MEWRHRISKKLFEELGGSVPALLTPYMFCHFERDDGYGNDVHATTASSSYRFEKDADLMSEYEGDIGLPPGYAQAEAVALRSDSIEDHAVACEQARCALRICPDSPSGHIVLALRGCSTREEAMIWFQEAERCAKASIPQATQAKAAASKLAWSEPIMRPLLRSLQGQINLLMRLGGEALGAARCQHYGDALGAARRLEALDAAPPHTRNSADWGDPWAFMPELLLRVKGPQAALQYMFRHPLADKLFTLPSCELPWLMTSALSYHMLHPDARGAVTLMRGDYNQNRTERQACQDGGALAILMRKNTTAIELVSDMLSVMSGSSPPPCYLPMEEDVAIASLQHGRPGHASVYAYHSGALWRDMPGAIQWLRTASSTICLYRHLLQASRAKPPARYSKHLVEQVVSMGVQATDVDCLHSREGQRVPTLLQLAVSLRQEEERIHACELLLRAGAWDADIIERAIREGSGTGVMELLMMTGALHDKPVGGNKAPLLQTAAGLGHYRELQVLLRTCHMGPHASICVDWQATQLREGSICSPASPPVPLTLIQNVFLEMVYGEALTCSHLGTCDSEPCQICKAEDGGRLSHTRPENREKVDFARCVQLLLHHGLVLNDYLAQGFGPGDVLRAKMLMEHTARARSGDTPRSMGVGGKGAPGGAAAHDPRARSVGGSAAEGTQRSGVGGESSSGSSGPRAARGSGGGGVAGGRRWRASLEAALHFLLEVKPDKQPRLHALLHRLPGPASCCWSCALPSSRSSLPSSVPSTMYLCGGCECATYCSAECQRKDWHGTPQRAGAALVCGVTAGGHQAECQYLQTMMSHF